MNVKIADGSEYEGEFEEGLRHGQGSYVTQFAVYNGTFERGKRTGFGVCDYNNGSKYEGYWVDGKRQGNGTYHFLTGAKYRGFFFFFAMCCVVD